jgi:hypothetical protein
MGKCNPPIDRFWELIEVMDDLAPGAKRYFGTLVANNNNADCAIKNIAIDPVELVEAMNNEQLSKLMFAIGTRLREVKGNERVRDEDLVLVV